MSAGVGAIVGGVVGAIIAVTYAGKKNRQTRIPDTPSPQTQDEANAMMDAVPSDILEQIVFELSQGNKIAAVKLIRDHTGLGLKDSKDIADQIEEKAL